MTADAREIVTVERRTPHEDGRAHWPRFFPSTSRSVTPTPARRSTTSALYRLHRADLQRAQEATSWQGVSKRGVQRHHEQGDQTSVTQAAATCSSGLNLEGPVMTGDKPEHHTSRGTPSRRSDMRARSPPLTASATRKCRAGSQTNIARPQVDNSILTNTGREPYYTITADAANSKKRIKSTARRPGAQRSDS